MRVHLALLCAAGLVAACEVDLPPPSGGGVTPTSSSAPSARPAASASASARSSASASGSATTTPAASPFAPIAARFLEDYLRDNPVRATEAGDHRYDGLWPDTSAAGEQKWLAKLVAYDTELAALDVAKLPPADAIDLQILRGEIARQRFLFEVVRETVQNPLAWVYLVGDGLDPLVTRSFAPVAERAKSLAARLEALPAVLESAQKRLEKAPKIHTETAIQQLGGLVSLVDTDLDAFAKELPEDGKQVLPAARQKASAALKAFKTFLEKDFLPKSTADFRLGAERFAQKLRLVLDDPGIEPDAMAKEAEALLVSTRADMAATALELWPTLFKDKPAPAHTSDAEQRLLVRAVLDELAKDRSTNATIVADAQKVTDELTAFVKKEDLVRVPDEPMKVIEMPEYRRGVAIAYCDSAGPLEPKAETFFAISPTPKDWDAKRAESFYREYNRSMLVDLSVHEAMPGHYLQLMHNNRFPSKLRAVFSSGPFVEGWAVYTEELMSKKGFGGAKVRLQRQKMALRMAMNAVLDHGIHAGKLDEAEALRRMKDEAFQEEGEAVGKWKRARLTSAQLTTYFYGYRKMAELRALAEKSGQWKNAEGGLSERAYHDALLSFGSPPPRHVRGLLGL